MLLIYAGVPSAVPRHIMGVDSERLETLESDRGVLGSDRRRKGSTVVVGSEQLEGPQEMKDAVTHDMLARHRVWVMIFSMEA